jgi:hypothetical protein
MGPPQGINSALTTLVQEFTTQARQLVYGEQATPPPGTSFSQIEDLACQVGDAVARALLQQTVTDQAPQMATATCACGQPLQDPDLEPHPLTTRRGDIGWQEPVGHCPACRRAFFPSEPGAGPGPGGGLQPGGPPEDGPGRGPQFVL